MKRSNETKIRQHSEDHHRGEHGSSRKREDHAPENETGGHRREQSQDPRTLSSKPKSGERKENNQHLSVAIGFANRTRRPKLGAHCRTRTSFRVKVLRNSPWTTEFSPCGVEIKLRTQHGETAIVFVLRVCDALKNREASHEASGKQQSPRGPFQSRVISNNVNHQEINRHSFQEKVNDL